ncbi:hypothetical protein HRI_002781700 [Hibiscus trionum]|uniref:Uncharacterized protein n=1 Tax=Hibiscus trionum TaxID=183268 RepID=A0A9W7I611_HIBTR|nr:hypothetical protein HRI_002781700 [Hibiscus trionum]
MAGRSKFNPPKFRKRVDAASTVAPTSLLRAKDDNAFAKWLLMVGFYFCLVNLEAQVFEKPAEANKKPAERKKPSTIDPNPKNPKKLKFAAKASLEAEYELSRGGSTRNKLTIEAESRDALKGSSEMQSKHMNGNVFVRSMAGYQVGSVFHTPTCSIGALLSKLPSFIPSYNATEPLEITLINHSNTTSQRGKADNGGSLGEIPMAESKTEPSSQLEVVDQEKPRPVKANLVLQDDAVIQLGFGPLKD